MTEPTGPSPLTWSSPLAAASREVRYAGQLAGRPGLLLHHGYDGWQEPLDVELEPAPDGTAVGTLDELDGVHVVDCVVTDGTDYDNNHGADYRLWVGEPPIDAHLHATHDGLDPMGFGAVCVALASAGIERGVISWQDNAAVDALVGEATWLRRLTWVVPGVTPVGELRRRLMAGSVGVKLHPAHDEYPADDRRLDRYLEVARELEAPVAIHTAAGRSDPDLIRKLADRHPGVRVVMYHTFLGWPEGRRRAARHAAEHGNIWLETSWCSSDEALRLLDEVGPERVLFGSDGAVDGPWHFVRLPPNLEGRETYNQALLRLACELPADVFAAYSRGNAQELFGLLPPPPHAPPPHAPQPPPPERSTGPGRQASHPHEAS